MKNLKWIISLSAAVIAVGAAIVAVIVFQEELLQCFGKLKQLCCKSSCSKNGDYEDFADM